MQRLKLLANHDGAIGAAFCCFLGILNYPATSNDLRVAFFTAGSNTNRAAFTLAGRGGTRCATYLSWGTAVLPHAGLGFLPRRNWLWPQCSHTGGQRQPCPGSQLWFFSNLVLKQKDTFTIRRDRKATENERTKSSVYIVCVMTTGK